MDSVEYNKLLSTARRVTGLRLEHGPYSEAELNNVIKDYRQAKQRKQQQQVSV